MQAAQAFLGKASGTLEFWSLMLGGALMVAIVMEVVAFCRALIPVVKRFVRLVIWTLLCIVSTRTVLVVLPRYVIHAGTLLKAWATVAKSVFANDMENPKGTGDVNPYLLVGFIISSCMLIYPRVVPILTTNLSSGAVTRDHTLGNTVRDTEELEVPAVTMSRGNWSDKALGLGPERKMAGALTQVNRGNQQQSNTLFEQEEAQYESRLDRDSLERKIMAILEAYVAEMDRKLDTFSQMIASNQPIPTTQSTAAPCVQTAKPVHQRGINQKNDENVPLTRPSEAHRSKEVRKPTQKARTTFRFSDYDETVPTKELEVDMEDQGLKNYPLTELEEAVKERKAKAKEISRELLFLSEEEKGMSLAELHRKWKVEAQRQREERASLSRFDFEDLGTITEEEKLLPKSQIKKIIRDRKTEKWAQDMKAKGIPLHQCEVCQQLAGPNHHCLATKWMTEGPHGLRKKLVLTQSKAGGVRLAEKRVVDQDKLNREYEAICKLKQDLELQNQRIKAAITPAESPWHAIEEELADVPPTTNTTVMPSPSSSHWPRL